MYLAFVGETINTDDGVCGVSWPPVTPVEALTQARVRSPGMGGRREEAVGVRDWGCEEDAADAAWHCWARRRTFGLSVPLHPLRVLHP